MALTRTKCQHKNNDPAVYYASVNGFILCFEKMCEKDQVDVNRNFKCMQKEQKLCINEWHAAGAETLKNRLKKGMEIAEEEGDKFIEILVSSVAQVKNIMDDKKYISNMEMKDVKDLLQSKIRRLLPYFDINSEEHKIFINETDYYFEMYFSSLTYSGIFIPCDTSNIFDPDAHVSEGWKATHEVFKRWFFEYIQKELLQLACPQLDARAAIFLNVYTDQNCITYGNPSMKQKEIAQYEYILYRNGKEEVYVSVYLDGYQNSNNTNNYNNNKKKKMQKSSKQRKNSLMNKCSFHQQTKQMKTIASCSGNNRFSNDNDNINNQQLQPAQISKKGRYKNKNKNKNSNNNRTNHGNDYQTILAALDDFKKYFTNQNEAAIEKMDRINVINQNGLQKTLSLLQHEIKQIKTDILAIKQQELAQKDHRISQLRSKNGELEAILEQRNAQIKTLHELQQISQEQSSMNLYEPLDNLNVDDDDNEGNNRYYADDDEDEDEDDDEHDDEHDFLCYTPSQQHLQNLDEIIRLVETKQQSTISYSSLNNVPSPSPCALHQNRLSDTELSDDDDEKKHEGNKKRKSKRLQNKSIINEKGSDSSAGDDSQESEHSQNDIDSNDSQSSEHLSSPDEDDVSDEDMGEAYVPGNYDDDNPLYSSYTYESKKKIKKPSQQKPTKTTNKKQKDTTNDKNIKKDDIAKELGAFKSGSTHPYGLHQHVTPRLTNMNNDCANKYIEIFDDIAKHAPTTKSQLKEVMRAYGHQNETTTEDDVTQTSIIKYIKDYLKQNDIEKSPMEQSM